MKRLISLLILTATFLAFTTGADARSRHVRHVTHTVSHYRVASLPSGGSGCTADNHGRTICSGSQPSYSTVVSGPRRGTVRVAYQGFNNEGGDSPPASMVSRGYNTGSSIGSPSGCARTNLSCACRLAAYWNLGGGLDKVSTWPQRFGRTGGPGIGVAVVAPSQHHIVGIVGGGPGAWHVVDFNSTNGHGNRSYVTAGFAPGSIYVNPHGGGNVYSARTHRRYASR